MSKEFTAEEIYPYIMVYNNVFEDPERMYSIVKEIQNSEEGIFENWKPWYEFGEKVEQFGVNFNKNINKAEIMSSPETINKKQENQKYFITELIKGFHLVNNDFIKRFNVDLDINAKSDTINSVYRENVDSEEQFVDQVHTWRWSGPSLCRYFIDAGMGGDLSMSYHSDYIREPIITPGYKFAITTTTYINDDYEGGDVDFIIDNKLLKYKPKMGDFLVFPSGHPKILTENGKVYLHGVKNNYKKEKFFTRLYWQIYDPGAKEWFENEEKYGKEEWLKMQPEIMKEYRETISTKNLDGLVRIK